MSGSDGWSRGYETESPAEPRESREPEGHGPKCGHCDTSYRAAAGKVSFMTFASAVWCKHCGYMELYRTSGNGNPVDWFLVTDEE